MAGKHLGHEEVHQGPKFHEVILERCPRNQEPPGAVEVEQSLPPLTFPILDHVSLVQNQVLPFLPSEHLRILHLARELSVNCCHSNNAHLLHVAGRAGNRHALIC